MATIESSVETRVHRGISSRAPALWRNPVARRTALLIITIGAALLRFAALGRQSLWLDEATDASFAARSLWNCIFAESVHPPLYRVLLHFAVSAFGNSNFAVRFLPAVFGILAVPAMALLAEEIFQEAQIAVALFAAASPFLIYYSQENRDYSLFILLSIASTWALFRFGRSGRGLFFYSTLCVLLMYTHYLGAFVLLAHEIVYWRHWRARPRDWIAGRVALVALFAPWAIWVVGHYHNESRIFLWPGWLVPAAMLRFLMGYGVDAADSARNAAGWRVKIFREMPVLLPALSFYAWILWRGLRRALRNPEARTLLAAMMLLPWGALLILAPWARLSHERYLAFQAPFVLLVLALGFCALRGRARLMAVAGLALTIGFSLLAYYGAPGDLLGYRFQYAKEDWAGAAAFLRAAHVDAVILAPGYLQLPLDRYSLGRAREITVPWDSANVPDLAGAHRVALVLSHTSEPQEQIRAAMDRGGRQVAEEDFTPQNLIQVIVYDVSSSGSEDNGAATNHTRQVP